MIETTIKSNSVENLPLASAEAKLDIVKRAVMQSESVTKRGLRRRDIVRRGIRRRYATGMLKRYRVPCMKSIASTIKSSVKTATISKISCHVRLKKGLAHQRKIKGVNSKYENSAPTYCSCHVCAEYGPC
jgi:hypothetical protein